jgi:hypothetical protein
MYKGIWDQVVKLRQKLITDKDFMTSFAKSPHTALTNSDLDISFPDVMAENTNIELSTILFNVDTDIRYHIYQTVFGAPLADEIAETHSLQLGQITQDPDPEVPCDGDGGGGGVVFAATVANAFAFVNLIAVASAVIVAIIPVATLGDENEADLSGVSDADSLLAQQGQASRVYFDPAYYESELYNLLKAKKLSKHRQSTLFDYRLKIHNDNRHLDDNGSHLFNISYKDLDFSIYAQKTETGFMVSPGVIH